MDLKKTRIAWIDLLRGFAILSIVYGHASRDRGLLAKIVYAYHVPLCVFITGWLLSCREQSLPQHLRQSGRRLLLPYVFWSLVSMAIYLLLGRLAADALGAETYSLSFNLRFMARGLSIGNAALWYLPFLFCTQLMLYLLLRLTEGRARQKWLFQVLPLIFSPACLLLYDRTRFYLPFGLSNACFLLFFAWAAYLLKDRLSFPEEKIWLAAILPLLGLTFFLALRFNDEVGYMCFDHSEYGRNIPVFYLTALSACLLFTWLARILRENRLLQWFGRNAMAILVMHKFPVLFFQLLLGGIEKRLGSFAFLLYLTITLLSAVLCCLVGSFLRKYFPLVLGEK